MVLVISSHPSNKPIFKLDFNGNSILHFLSCKFISGRTDYDIELTYGEGARVYYSCTATLNGEFWVLGGGPDKYLRQVISGKTTKK